MKYVFKSFNFGIITHREAEVLLNSMADRGYEFKGLCRGYAQGTALFEQNGKAKEFTYSVDARYGLGEEDVENLCDFYHDMGWEYMGNYRKKLYIFVSKNKNSPPLYTDEYSKYEILEEAMRQDGEPYAFLVCAMVGAVGLWLFIKMGNSFDSRLVSYFFFILCSMMTVLYGSITVDSFIYRAKCKRVVESGGVIPENHMRRELTKWSNCANHTIFVAAPLMEVCGCMHLMLRENTNLMLNIGDPVLVLLILWSILSVPLLLWSSYKSCRFPQKKYWVWINCAVAFLYYVNMYGFLSVYLQILFQ